MSWPAERRVSWNSVRPRVTWASVVTPKLSGRAWNIFFWASSRIGFLTSATTGGGVGGGGGGAFSQEDTAMASAATANEEVMCMRMALGCRNRQIAARGRDPVSQPLLISITRPLNSTVRPLDTPDRGRYSRRQTAPGRRQRHLFGASRRGISTSSAPAEEASAPHRRQPKRHQAFFGVSRRSIGTCRRPP